MSVEFRKCNRKVSDLIFTDFFIKHGIFFVDWYLLEKKSENICYWFKIQPTNHNFDYRKKASHKIDAKEFVSCKHIGLSPKIIDQIKRMA